MKNDHFDDKFILHRNQRKSLEELFVDETIFSQANGVLGTRGHFAEGYGLFDYPQTYINGFYNLYPLSYEENYQQFPQFGQTIVNLPDASQIRLESDEGPIHMHHMALVDLKRTMDMSKGITTRIATYQSKKGTLFLVKEEKIVPSNTMMIITKLSLSSPSYEGPIRMISTLTMPKPRRPRNMDPRLPHALKHLDLVELHTSEHYGYLTAITTQSLLKIRVGMTHDVAFQYRVEYNDILATRDENLKKNQTLEVIKYQIYDPRPVLDTGFEAGLNHLKDFEAYVNQERVVKKRFWDQTFLDLDDPQLAQALRYNIYQLDQSGGIKDTISIAAKGLSGDGYEGHYFWDTEVYMLPFFILTQPEKAKRMLTYRYTILDEARKEARNLGIQRGAKIPWRTINGKESSPYYPAGSAQIHINSDIAFSIIMYYRMTQDDEFMIQYGVELLLETALFLLDWGHFKEGSFHIDGVTGPDEYTAIVNDNYHTNKMAQTHFDFTYRFIMDHLDRLTALLEKLNVTEVDLHQLMEASQKMTLLSDPKTGIIQQDKTFMEKKEWDLAAIPKHHFPLLLHFHPLHIYKHQVLKQADALVAMVLHQDLDQDTFEKTLAYYLKRTTHDSSLSKCMYGIALYRMGHDTLAYDYFHSVATLDLLDHKKHTTYGLHLANLGGSYLMMVYGLFGITIKDRICINPVKQNMIKKAEFRMRYKDSTIRVSLEKETITLSTDRPIELMVHGVLTTVEKDITIGVKKIDHTHFLKN